jgi:hypothetical protein
MPQVGWTLVALGLALVALGLLWQFVPLGRLPGDIVVNQGNVKFFFPLTTCLLISLTASAALWLFRWLGR